MPDPRDDSRRSFLRLAGGAGMLPSGGAPMSEAQDKPKTGSKPEEGEEVSPAEDLMREHGVLDRVLLVYDEAVRRLEGGRELDPAVLTGSAGIVRRFIEDYHEKLEENGKVVDEVARLERQLGIHDLAQFTPR